MPATGSEAKTTIFRLYGPPSGVRVVLTLERLLTITSIFVRCAESPVLMILKFIKKSIYFIVVP